MYNEKRQYVKPESKLADIISNNPSLLYVLEYLEAEYILQDKTVSVFCDEQNIDVNLFTTISNIYNGFTVEPDINLDIANIPLIIKLLHNTHSYYQKEKYLSTPFSGGRLSLTAKNARVRFTFTAVERS